MNNFFKNITFVNNNFGMNLKSCSGRLFSFIFFMILILGSSERSYSQAKFILNVTGGYSQPVGNFRNSIGINDTASADWPYLMMTGYNLDLTGKLTMNKAANIKLVFNLGYNGFKNWGDLNTIVPAAETDGGSGTETQTVQFLPDVSIIVVSLGAQYDFNPKSSVNPFAGLDLTANFFGGNFGSNPSSNFPKNTLKSETRFGLQLGGGVDFNCNDYIGVICGMKYNFANLIGKGDYQSDATSSEIVLNDNTGSRNISYLQIYAGVSFYIGNVVK